MKINIINNFSVTLFREKLMFNFEDNSLSNSISLCDINERLLSIESIILYQKEEILKSEYSVSLYEKCLFQQNEALNKFINEKDKLLIQRSKRIKLSSDDDRNCKDIYDSVLNIGIESKNKRRINRSTFKIFDKINNKDADIDNPGSHNINSTEMANQIMSNTNAQSVNILSPKKINDNLKSQLPLKKLTIVHGSYQTVTKIAVLGNDMFVSGTEGLLLKHNPRNTTIYDTGTEDEISQIEIVKHGKVSYLIGFTKEKMVIFEGMESVRRDEYIPGIGRVFNDINLLYIPTESAEIRKFYVNNGKLADHGVYISGHLCAFVPGTGSNISALVSFQDGRLCITEKNELRTLQEVPGVDNVKGVLRIRYSNFLCYSDRNIWFFNPKFELIGKLEYEEGLKLVDVTYTCGVVVDGGNTVHGYRVQDSGCFGTEICSRTIDGNVTALCIAKRNVLVAVASDVFEIANMF